jgi:hypothetical protein
MRKLASKPECALSLGIIRWYQVSCDWGKLSLSLRELFGAMADRCFYGTVSLSIDYFQRGNSLPVWRM